MESSLIREIASYVVSGLALIISIIKRKSVTNYKTDDEIINKAKAKFDKYVDKQRKKNHISSNNSSEVNDG